MKREDFKKLLVSVHEQMVALTESKGEEYKGAEDDQLGNFRRASSKIGIGMAQVWFVYFTKHMDAIDTFIRDEVTGFKRQRSESIESRIDDAILYLILLKAIVRDTGKQEQNEHWLLEANRQINQAPKSTDRPLYIGCAVMSDDVKAAKAQGQTSHTPVTIVSHPDALHGVALGGEFWWVGPHNDPLGNEFEEKCRLRGLSFYNYVRG